MTPSTLAPPPRPAGPRTPPPERPRTARRYARPAHHGAERRVWTWAIVGSVVVHLLVVLFSPLVIRVGLPPGTPADEEADAFRGIQMVELGAERPATPSAVEAVAADATEPVPLPDPRQPPPAPDARPARPGEPAGTPATDAAGRPLEPGLRDRRLWVTPRDVPRREPTQEELHAEYMAGLERRLRTWNDSIAGEADRQRRATDWTVRDGGGGRWGVSPEGIHLGGLTLPPVEFPPGGGDPDRRRRVEEEERTRGELDRQEADTERRRAREEAIRSTRERADREREERRRNPPG